MRCLMRTRPLGGLPDVPFGDGVKPSVPLELHCLRADVNTRAIFSNIPAKQMLDRLNAFLKTPSGAWTVIAGVAAGGFIVGLVLGEANCQSLRDANEMKLSTIAKTAQEATGQMLEATSKFRKTLINTSNYETIEKENAELKSKLSSAADSNKTLENQVGQLRSKLAELTAPSGVRVFSDTSKQMSGVIVGMTEYLSDTARISAFNTSQLLKAGQTITGQSRGKDCVVTALAVTRQYADIQVDCEPSPSKQ